MLMLPIGDTVVYYTSSAFAKDGAKLCRLEFHAEQVLCFTCGAVKLYI